MRFKKKKGFTIIELVIVIAVIGILTAILVPTFINLTNKANEAADQSLVKNLNTTLSVAEADIQKGYKKPSNPTDMFEILKGEGYIGETLIRDQRSGKKILYNLNKNRFLFEEDKTSAEYKSFKDEDFWAFGLEVDTTGYSTYLLEEYNSTAALNITSGLDVGANDEVTSITYTGSVAKNVVIRTNGGTLTVNASNDSVKHYGYADSVNIEAVKTSSYHENGRVPFMSMQYGRVVLESSSEVTHIHFERKTESSFDDIIVAAANSIELPDFSRDPVTIGSEDVLVVEVQSNNSSEFVWLQANGNGTIEDSKVLVSSTKTGEKTAVTEQSAGEHVKQIANTKVGDNVIEGGKTAEQVEAIKNEVIDEYYETEFIPTGVPSNAVVYIYNHQTKELKSFTSLEEAFNTVEDGGTITVCKDIELENLFEISDKSVNIVGQNDMKPEIVGNFKVAHTTGGHSVVFKNLKIVTALANKSLILDASSCEDANSVNELLVENCVLYSTINNAACAMINISPSSVGSLVGVTGTHLTATNNTFMTDSYTDNNAGVGYAFAAIASSLIENNTTENCNYYSYMKHDIIGNKFYGRIYYSYVGGYANFISNEVDQNYKNGTANTDGRVFQIRGSWATNPNGSQLELTINKNVFKNVKELIKFYRIDNCDISTCQVDLAGSEGPSKNIFENVKNLASGSNSNTYLQSIFAIEKLDKQWEGITNATVTMVLAKVELHESGTLQTGYMTLPNGKQTMTYTQAIAPVGGRTGLYIEVSDVRLWYFCDKTDNEHYFIDDNDNVYSIRLVSGGLTTLADCEFTNTVEPQPSNWTDEDNGKIYNASFTINTFDSNTLYNASASQEGNKVTVSASAGKTAADINLFISNIGEKSKLLITNNASATADSDTLIYVVPEGTGQVNTYGNWDVTVDGNIVNYQTNNKQTIIVNAGKSVTGNLTITGSAAKESTLTNNGSIGKVNFNTKASLTNNGTINSVNVVDLNTKATVVVTEYVINAYDSSIVNNGTINFVGSSTKITLTNNEGAEIGDLWLTAAADNDEVYSRAVGSVIVNNGTMAAMNKRTININVRCTFTNNGVIGKEGRGAEGEHSEAGCDNYGGTIYIGNYSGGSLHDGLIFVNNGTIYAGARHNGTSHQQVTFWICGSKNKVINITVSNTETITGRNWRTTFGNAANVSGITIDNNMGN